MEYSPSMTSEIHPQLLEQAHEIEMKYPVRVVLLFRQFAYALAVSLSSAMDGAGARKALDKGVADVKWREVVQLLTSYIEVRYTSKYIRHSYWTIAMTYIF